MRTNDHALLHAIELLPGYLRDLTLTIASRCEVDLGLALSTLLSGMTSGVHGLFAVRRPDGSVEMLSVIHVVLAGTTSGKSKVHRLVHRAHNAEDKLRTERYKKGKKADPSLCLRDVLHPLANARVLVESLDGVGHATAISSHEGDTVLSSHLFKRQLGTVIVLRDGDDKVVLPLSNGDRLIAHDASLNVLFMPQRLIFQQYLEKYGSKAMGIGFLQRCLFTVVPSSSSGLELPETGDGVCVDEYERDAAAYLDAQWEKLQAGDTERQVIDFSPSAKLLWYRLEGQLKQNQDSCFPWIQEARNRAMENVSRLAGAIHAYYPRRPGDSRIEEAIDECANSRDEISVATLNSAWAIVQWYLMNFGQVFPPEASPMPPPQKPTAHDRHVTKIREDADTIMLHFRLHCGKSAESSAPKRAVMSRSGLYPQRFNSALFFLTDQNFIIEEGEGRKASLRAGGVRWVHGGMQN